jgi:hypothetical protein
VVAAVFWIRGATVSGRVWASLAMYFGFWIAVAMVLGTIRPALDTAPRYFYPGVMFLLIVAAEIFRVPPKLNGRAWTVAAVVFFSAATANAFQLHYAARYVADISGVVRAELGALELARGTVDGGFLPDAAGAEIIGPVGIPGVQAGQYFAAIDEYGSPAFSPGQLASGNELERKAADGILTRALGVAPVPAARLRPTATIAKPIEVVGGATSRQGDCLRFNPDSPGAYFTVAAAPPEIGVLAVDPAPGQIATLAVGRFADGEPIPIGAINGDQSYSMNFPPLASPAPGAWRVRIAPTAPILACVF